MGLTKFRIHILHVYGFGVLFYTLFFIKEKKQKNTLKLDNDDRDKLNIFASSGAHVAYLSLDLQ